MRDGDRRRRKEEMIGLVKAISILDFLVVFGGPSFQPLP